MGRLVQNLDSTDRALIRELQTDGHIINQDLAAKVGLSPAGCLDRVRRLKERGVIRRYTVEIDPEAVDLALLIFIEVKLDRTSSDALGHFAKLVESIPEILECHMVAGAFDFLVKARVRDMNAYKNFLGIGCRRYPASEKPAAMQC
jgi:Lrp/AsnC family transcriptional regulator, leucine-responsive regulatory protein